MFNLRDFIKRGLLDSIGKMADYQVILNAAGWFEKGVLIEDDLKAIEAVIDTKNAEEDIIPINEELPNTNGV